MVPGVMSAALEQQSCSQQPAPVVPAFSVDMPVWHPHGALVREPAEGLHCQRETCKVVPHSISVQETLCGHLQGCRGTFLKHGSFRQSERPAPRLNTGAGRVAAHLSGTCRAAGASRCSKATGLWRPRACVCRAAGK